MITRFVGFSGISLHFSRIRSKRVIDSIIFPHQNMAVLAVSDPDASCGTPGGPHEYTAITVASSIPTQCGAVIIYSRHFTFGGSTNRTDKELVMPQGENTSRLAIFISQGRAHVVLQLPKRDVALPVRLTLEQLYVAAPSFEGGLVESRQRNDAPCEGKMLTIDPDRSHSRPSNALQENTIRKPPHYLRNRKTCQRCCIIVLTELFTAL